MYETWWGLSDVRFLTHDDIMRDTKAGLSLPFISRRSGNDRGNVISLRRIKVTKDTRTNGILPTGSLPRRVWQGWRLARCYRARTILYQRLLVSDVMGNDQWGGEFEVLRGCFP